MGQVGEGRRRVLPGRRAVGLVDGRWHGADRSDDLVADPPGLDAAVAGVGGQAAVVAVGVGPEVHLDRDDVATLRRNLESHPEEEVVAGVVVALDLLAPPDDGDGRIVGTVLQQQDDAVPPPPHGADGDGDVGSPRRDQRLAGQSRLPRFERLL